MKQPERVAELLAELRALAENNFERHRIDVLKRDLTAPPVVEQVDDTHQRFNGVTYTKRDNGRYQTSCISIYRDVWRYFFGYIPEGYEIHHVDKNKENNDISNLQMLTVKEHKAAHRQEATCPICGKTFNVRNHGKIYCSRDCANEAKRSIFDKQCPVCGKIFKMHNRDSKYCSHSCANKARSQADNLNKQ